MTNRDLYLTTGYTVTLMALLRHHYGNAPITNEAVLQSFCNYLLISFSMLVNISLSLIINRKWQFLYILWYYLRIVCISLLKNFELLRENTISHEAYVDDLNFNLQQIYRFSMIISFFELSLSIKEALYQKVNGWVIFLYKNSFVYRLIGLRNKNLLVIFLPFILF